MGYAKDVLVSTDWVAEHLDDPNVVVAEVDENTDLYEEGHIPGAVKLHWKAELQDPVKRDVDRAAGVRAADGVEGHRQRHRRSSSTATRTTGSPRTRSGTSSCTATRTCRIMDGGRQKWVDEGRELTTDEPRPCGASYAAEPLDESPARLARRCAGHRQQRRHGAGRRAQPAGVHRRADRHARLPAGGRAARRPHPRRARSRGRRRSTRTARSSRPTSCAQLYGGKGVTGDGPVTAYCRIGERSSHTWFVLRELLGFDDVRNYDGSWTEWGNLVDVPIVKGSEPK